MIIKVLEDWKYTPTAYGNEKMTVTFNRLSGAEELSIRRDNEDDDEYKTAIFIASIKSIKDPFIIEELDGKQRPMTVADIPASAELKELFFELVLEYGKNTVVSEDAIKKQE